MRTTIAVLTLLLLAGPAGAESLFAKGAGGAGRYQIQPVEGGVARLDTETGAISYCTVAAGAMTCSAGGEEGERLRARVEELESHLSSGSSGSPAPPDAEDKDAQNTPSAGADEEAEFDAALDRMKRALRAFGDVAREFEGRSGTAPEKSLESAPDRT